MNPLTVSIAMCTYNGARFLQKQLDSFSKQTRLPDEVVVCDDGSTDNTLEILEIWAKTVSFSVRIIRNETNLGYAQNFGKAVSLCTCDVIFFSDQDDIWEPEKIEKMTDIFENEPEICLIVSDGYIIDENDQRQTGGIQETNQLWFYDEPATFCVVHPSLEDCYPQGCASAIRASLKSVFLPVPPHWSHDTWLQVTYHLYADRCGKVISESLFSYRRHSGNTMGGTHDELQRHWERKKRIHHWNMAEQFWAWQPAILEFRKRVEELPNGPIKRETLNRLASNQKHFTRRMRVQRNFLFYGFFWFIELIRGGYCEHIFPFRAAFFDLRRGIFQAMNPINDLQEFILQCQKVTKRFRSQN